MKLLVVITSYKVTDLTIDCLHSCAREIDSVPGMKVAVCENGTGDDSAERLKKVIIENGWDAWCSLVAVTPNLGYTGGTNVLLRPAIESANPPEYVLLLNADTVVQPNAFKLMVDFMDEHPKVGIAGPRLQYPDGLPQISAFRFFSPMGEFDAGLKLGFVSRLLKDKVVALPIPDRSCEVEWVAGAVSIVRIQVFRDIGVFDDGYYTHYEDVDHCLNARRAGWDIWYLPESRIIHFVGQSTGITVAKPKRFPAYYFQARRRFFLKNYGPLYAALCDAALIVGSALWRLRVLLTGKEDPTPPYFLSDSIRHSIFVTGFGLHDVPNPALAGGTTEVEVEKLIGPLSSLYDFGRYERTTVSHL